MPDTPRSGYCSSSDLITGNVPLPQYLSRDQAIAAAADEMDSYLGFIYQVPIQTTTTDSLHPIPSVVGLTLKRINYSLASGRILLQLAAAQENAQLHAYGLSLVTEALSALKAIKDGQMVLDNVPPANGSGLGLSEPVPLISNLDPESNVEAYYNRIAAPGYGYLGGISRGDGYR